MQVPADDPRPASASHPSSGPTRRGYLAGLASVATAGVAGCSLLGGGSDGEETGLGPLARQWGHDIEAPARPTFDDAGLYLSGNRGYAGVDRDVGVYALRTDGSERWRATTRDGTSGVGLGDGAAYVGSSDGRVYAFDAASGSRRWRYRYGSGEGLTSGSWLRPAAVDDVVVATVEHETDDGTGVHAVVGLDATSGERLWRTALVDSACTVPLVLDGAVVFGTDAGRVYAVEAASGDVRWRVEAGDSVRGPLVREGDAVFARSRDDHLYALGVDGALRWTAAFGNDVTAGPAVAGGRVVAGSADYTVAALGVDGGDERWRHEGRAAVSTLAVSGDGDTVYVGTEDGTVRAHAATTGEVDWSAEANRAGNPVEWLAARNGRLYAGEQFGVQVYGDGGGAS